MWSSHTGSPDVKGITVLLNTGKKQSQNKIKDNLPHLCPDQQENLQTGQAEYSQL